MDNLIYLIAHNCFFRVYLHYRKSHRNKYRKIKYAKVYITSILQLQYARSSLLFYFKEEIMNYYEEYLPAIKNIIKSNATAILKKASKSGYVCPICGSGSGVKGTGITTRDGIYFTCWRGCFTHSDIIDIIGMLYGIDKYLLKIKAAADKMGVNMQLPYDCEKQLLHLPVMPATNQFIQVQHQEPEVDYADFFYETHKNINLTNYHRGLSNKIIDKYKIGYCHKWRHPKAPNAPYSPRLIIPTSSYSYLARDTRHNLNEIQKKYAKIKVGKIHLFNAQEAIQSNRPIFVVEGEIDALSIIDVGAQAIALGSVSNYKKLVNLLIDNNVPNKIILALDNDVAGKETAAKIMEALRDKDCIIYNIIGTYKDPNDIFVNNKKEFIKLIYKAIHNK